MLINYDLNFAEENNKSYLTDPPWPHIVIDNFFNDEVLTEVQLRTYKNQMSPL